MIAVVPVTFKFCTPLTGPLRFKVAVLTVRFLRLEATDASVTEVVPVNVALAVTNTVSAEVLMVVAETDDALNAMDPPPSETNAPTPETVPFKVVKPVPVRVRSKVAPVTVLLNVIVAALSTVFAVNVTAS